MLFSKAASAFSRGLALLAMALPVFGGEITDVTGARVQLVDHPTRIVTLAPSLAELAADLSGENLERIVGVTDYTDYPPALSKRPSVGAYSRFNLEKVLTLKPDLVLATRDGNPKDQVLHLRELKVPVVVVSTESLNEVLSSVKLVGQAMGEKERGDRLAEQLGRGFESIKKKAGTARPRVLLQVGDDPFVAVGGKSFLNEALEAVGGRNLYAESSAGYPRPSLEDVVSRDPDVILVLAFGAEVAPYQKMARKWAQFPKLKAVRNRRVKVLQSDELVRPSARILEGLDQLQKAIQEKPSGG